MTKIVRKVDRVTSNRLAAWVNGRGELMGWWELTGNPPTAEKQIALLGDVAGWPVTETHARMVGTTLSALRDELGEGGEDG